MNTAEEKLFGFRFVRFLDLCDWKELELTPASRAGADLSGWVENFACPCSEGTLKTAVTMWGNGAQRVRVGVCALCGYIGYIDRPTREWIKNFYLNTWEDTESPKVKKLVYKIKHGKDQKQREILNVIQKLKPDPARPICEIGCGYGSTLNQIRQMGFHNTIAIENSTHRADFAREFFKFEVLNAPFEDSGVQTRLREKGPFSLIFSHHVFEHVYDPGELIGLASRLQKEGDYFVISLPHAEGEFSMSNILYFPHLHSFRKNSLTRLLLRHNYEVVDSSATTNLELTLVAKKVSAAPAQNFPAENYFEQTIEKFAHGLGLGRRYSFSPRRLWWYRALNVGGQVRHFLRQSFDAIHWNLAKKIIPYVYRADILREAGIAGLRKNQPMQSILVEDIKERRTSYAESPIEIQFDGNVKLTYK